MEVTIGIGEALGTGPARGDHARQRTLAFEVRQPLIEGGVGLGQAHEQKVAVLGQNLLAEGLVTVQVITQEGDRAQRREPRRPLRQPSRAGGQFAVLFEVTILRRDERGGQGKHGRLARRDQRRGDGAMDMAGLTVGQRAGRAQ